MKKVILLIALMIVSIFLMGCGERAGNALSALDCEHSWEEYKSGGCGDQCTIPIDSKCHDKYGDLSKKCPVKCPDRLSKDDGRSLSDRTDTSVEVTDLSTKTVDSKEEKVAIADSSENLDSVDQEAATVQEAASFNEDALGDVNNVATTTELAQKSPGDTLNCALCTPGDGTVLSTSCYDVQYTEIQAKQNLTDCSCGQIEVSWECDQCDKTQTNCTVPLGSQLV